MYSEIELCLALMTASAPSLHALFRAVAGPVKSFVSSTSKSSTLRANSYGLRSLGENNSYKIKISGGRLSNAKKQNTNESEQEIVRSSSDENVDRVTKTVKIEVNYVDENGHMSKPQ